LSMGRPRRAGGGKDAGDGQCGKTRGHQAASAT
jgi:hypothetical protein